MIHPRVALPCLFALGLGTADPTAAQDISIRLSIKYILDNDGNRPSGRYDNEENILEILVQTNQALKRWGRGYQYVVDENPFPDVQDASEFFVLGPRQSGLLEAAAEAAPAQFFWRLDAVNVYIISSYSGGSAGAAIPSGEPLGGEIVVFSVGFPESLDTLWPHELGHHNDLYHTFDADDHVDDTREDPFPKQCQGAGSRPCSVGGDKECCCATKQSLLDAAAAGSWSAEEKNDIRWNNMSYHCNLTFDNIAMTDGQLDRWADATRRYHSGEVSGLTYVVDGNNVTPPFDGYSTDPFFTVAAGIAATNPDGGDVVSIRAGSYDETMTISNPVTVRATRGSVTIGQ